MPPQNQGKNRWRGMLRLPLATRFTTPSISCGSLNRQWQFPAMRVRTYLSGRMSPMPIPSCKTGHNVCDPLARSGSTASGLGHVYNIYYVRWHSSRNSSISIAYSASSNAFPQLWPTNADGAAKSRDYLYTSLSLVRKFGLLTEIYEISINYINF